MILQELYKLYERKNREGKIARPGFEYKEIPYLIIIDSHGNFVRFESTIYNDGRNKKSRIFHVPAAVKRSSGIEANLLWDNLSYVLGIPNGEAERNLSKSKQVMATRLKKQKKAFYDKIKKFFAQTGIPELKAVIAFENVLLNELQKDPLWSEITTSKTGANLTFKIDGQNEIICANSQIMEHITKNLTSQGSKDFSAMCLVTGKEGEIEKIHPAIKGVLGAQSTGANIVSFNLPSFVSYGKEQSYNAPVSKYAAFAYTSALNHLLSKYSQQKIVLGDTTIVFWAEKENPLENDFAKFFTFSEDTDNQSREIQATESIRRLLEAPKIGSKTYPEQNIPFYVLGLAPNSSRLAIRFWLQDTVKQIEDSIRQYFLDLKIIKPKIESDILPLAELLRATAVQGKRENIHPLLTSGLFAAALKNQPFPRIVLSCVIGRMHAEPEASQKFEYYRAALLKAYLNRLVRASQYKTKLLEENMDEKNTNVAYRLGRLFAVLEYLQGKAIGNPNASIRDRYFASASSRPASVFPKLLNLAGYHVAKVKDEGGKWIDKLIQDILSVFPSENPFPRVMTLEEQGLFAVGYYQQKQWLWTKKEERA